MGSWYGIHLTAPSQVRFPQKYNFRTDDKKVTFAQVAGAAGVNGGKISIFFNSHRRKTLIQQQNLSQFNSKQRLLEMRFSTFLSMLPFLAGAIALPSEKKTSKGFSVVAINSDSPAHNLKLDASSTYLYLNGETDVWCPPEVVKASGCPGGNITVRDASVLASANYMVCLIRSASQLHSQLMNQCLVRQDPRW